MEAMKLARSQKEQPTILGRCPTYRETEVFSFHPLEHDSLTALGVQQIARKHPPAVNRPQAWERFHHLVLTLQEDAVELGLPELESQLEKELYRILESLQTVWVGSVLTYLVPDDGSVVIDIRGARPDGIGIWISRDLTVYCSGEKAGETWNQPESPLSEFPNVGLLDRLRELGV